MLFNVVYDLGEHDEVSNKNPAIMARLAAALDAMRKTAVKASFAFCPCNPLQNHLLACFSGDAGVAGRKYVVA